MGMTICLQIIQSVWPTFNRDFQDVHSFNGTNFVVNLCKNAAHAGQHAGQVGAEDWTENFRNRSPDQGRRKNEDDHNENDGNDDDTY